MKNALLILSVFIGIILCLIACEDEQDESDWTVMVYIAADNGLNDHALDDINEMEMAYIPGDVRVVVQVDWSEYNSVSEAQRFLIRHDETDAIGSKFLSNLGETDSGDWRTLSGFVNWATDEYPAKRYALVIWSHGDSWYRDGALTSICTDNESNNRIGVRSGDFNNAMASMKKSIEILIFDACLMQGLEVMGETGGKVRYIVGSEEEICTDGFPFEETFNLWNTTSDAKSLSESIVDAYVDSYRPGGSQEGTEIKVTCSAADYLMLQALQDSLSAFATTWKDSASTSIFHDARERCIEFGTVAQDIDVRQFFTLLHDSTSDSLLARDTQAIIDQIDALFYHSDNLNCPEDFVTSGTIWFPDNDIILHNLTSDYRNVRFGASNWLEFLYAFHGEELD